MRFPLLMILWMVCISTLHAEPVKVGAEVLFEENHHIRLLKGKRVGLITNQTAINSNCQTTLEILCDHPQRYQLVSVYAPEHGFFGDAYAYEVVHDHHLGSVPIYSLHGQTRRPTTDMLKNVDVLLFDIQDIGSRSYTYLSTLCYCIEEAAKHKIKFVVLDRPNPLGGKVVDGPLLKEKYRSFLGYINVPYCHGMTIGELALLFNEEYKVGCDLEVIPMKGWKREMTFKETSLTWVPTSPQIPESDTPFFYPSTGLIGHWSLVSIGIGYTLPFKLIGAPWIEADEFAKKLNEQNLPGVFFQPYHYRPFFGKFKLETCHGVRIVVKDPGVYLPVSTQFTILGVLRSLYPQKYEDAMIYLNNSVNRRETFNKINGDEEILRILSQEKFFIWKIRERFVKDRDVFLPIRKKYLLYPSKS